MKKSLIIFDLDGTIQDSSLIISEAINHVREALGLKAMDREIIVKNINNTKINPAKFFYDSENLSVVHNNLFMNFYEKNHNRLLRVYDGVESLIIRLKSRGCLVALATNAYRDVAVSSLKSLNIFELFDDIICGDDVVEAKPNPQMLFKILKSLNRTAQEAIFVGDGERDLLASKMANIDFILVNWGFDKHKDGISSIEKLKERLEILC